MDLPPSHVVPGSVVHLPQSQANQVDPGIAAFSAAILASIFRLAARIISSLLFCSSDWRSSLLLLHFLAAASSEDSSDCSLTLSSSLYLWIRLGCVGFSAGLPDLDVAAAAAEAPFDPGGGGGWKVIGGYSPSSQQWHKCSHRKRGGGREAGDLLSPSYQPRSSPSWLRYCPRSSGDPTRSSFGPPAGTSVVSSRRLPRAASSATASRAVADCWRAMKRTDTVQSGPIEQVLLPMMAG